MGVLGVVADGAGVDEEAAAGADPNGVHFVFVLYMVSGPTGNNLFRGPAGTSGPEPPSNRWAASRPIGWQGLLSHRGRLDPNNHRFPVGPKTMYKKHKCTCTRRRDPRGGCIGCRRQRRASRHVTDALVGAPRHEAAGGGGGAQSLKLVLSYFPAAPFHFSGLLFSTLFPSTLIVCLLDLPQGSNNFLHNPNAKATLESCTEHRLGSWCKNL